METVIAAILGFCMLFILVSGMATLLYLIQGWAISILWAWFIVPIFTIPQISITQSIGLAIFMGVFSQYRAPKKEESQKPLQDMMSQLLKPLIAVGIGWIVKGFL